MVMQSFAAIGKLSFPYFECCYQDLDISWSRDVIGHVRNVSSPVNSSITDDPTTLVPGSGLPRRVCCPLQ